MKKSILVDLDVEAIGKTKGSYVQALDFLLND